MGYLLWVQGIITERCSHGSNYQQASIGSDNDLALSRRQAIIWSNDGLVYWHMNVLLDNSVLRRVFELRTDILYMTLLGATVDSLLWVKWKENDSKISRFFLPVGNEAPTKFFHSKIYKTYVFICLKSSVSHCTGIQFIISFWIVNNRMYL